jgi:hypothetical protein
MVPTEGFEGTSLAVRQKQSDPVGSLGDSPYLRQRGRTALRCHRTEEIYVLRGAGDDQFIIITLSKKKIFGVAVEYAGCVIEILADRNLFFE